MLKEDDELFVSEVEVVCERELVMLFSDSERC